MTLIFHMVFFFSSRRRHTRLQGDWSSDVCSSDLKAQVEAATGRKRPGPLFIIDIAVPRDVEPAVGDIEQVFLYRSEERRVGKECRARVTPEYCKNKISIKR